MARQQAAKKKRNVIDFPTQVENAFVPDVRKKFTLHDLRRLTPLTENQKLAFNQWADSDNTVLAMLGFAGTGKTALSCYLALREILDERTPYEKLYIIKSTVECRPLGSLPGDVADKVNPYKEPYRHIFDELFPFKKSFDNMESIGMVEFMPTAYLRGLSFNNCIVIFEECQDNTFTEGETVLTRLGNNARMIINGDFEQNDIGNKSGYRDIIPILRRTAGTAFVNFGLEDIVRSGWVKNYLIAKYKKN